MSDDVSIVVNGHNISGWQRVRITRGIERCPSDFDISLTEKYPSSGIASVVVRPGDACQVKIGDDLVLTGYVDRYIPSISKRSHEIRIVGRGKCQDLVDCAAQWPNGQITGATALEIAKKLAKPYGIEVTADKTEDPLILTAIPQLNLILTETAWEVIERTCRYRGILAYDLPDGNLFLSRVGEESMASGFAEGQNVQEARLEWSADQRFSEYHIYLQSVDCYKEFGTSGNQIAVIKDDNISRPRHMSIVAEGGGLGANIAIARGRWEKNRREGRAHRLSVTVDNWRDSSGKLWTPNKLASCSLPSLRVPDPVDWIIGEVTYNKNEMGTTANVVLMPPMAFSVEPVLLMPVIAELSDVFYTSSGYLPVR